MCPELYLGGRCVQVRWEMYSSPKCFCLSVEGKLPHAKHFKTINGSIKP